MFIPRRLDKFLSESTTESVAKLRHALEEKEVQVRSQGRSSIEQEGNRLIFEDDQVLLNEKLVQPRPDCRVFVLNKPKSVTSTVRDPGGKQDLSAWMKTLPPGVFPVGRLDRESTGALLLTDSGDLSTALLQPHHKTPKTYWLWLNESIDAHDPRLESWLIGLPMLGGTARALTVEILQQTPDMTELSVVLNEGKNRQLRRMCSAMDLRLLHLHRRAVGPIEVTDLALGALRELTSGEIDALWQSAGGRQAVAERKVQALRLYAERMRAQQEPHLRLEEWLHALPQFA